MADVVKTKKELRAELVAALRSGEYQQGKGYLSFRSHKNGPTKMCCLGVACTLLEQPEQKNYRMDGSLYIDLWAGQGIGLSGKIMQLYGFSTTSGDFFITEELQKKFPLLERCGSMVHGRRRTTLTNLNDIHNWTFKEIADLIEAEPEGLFVD